MPSVTGGEIPPTYRIDLSLPPRQRYVEVTKAYSGQVQSLTGLFDDLVKEVMPSISPRLIHSIARLLLRRAYSREETEEIRGISETGNVPMYLVVSFNVLLDVLLGCTSGGVRVREGRKPQQVTKMLHFRTLDWGMDPLRDVLVQLEFVRSKSSEPEKVLATNITYLGFVGVLTGLREGLSMSLNFRPVHAADTRIQNIRFYFNQLMVLFGIRPSIASRLRQYLLPINESSFSQSKEPQQSASQKERFHSLADILSRLPSTPSTCAYLTFSTGAETYVMEKDNRSAKIRSSDSFVATTNHDLEHENQPNFNSDPPSNDDLDGPEESKSVSSADFVPNREALAAPVLHNLDEAITESIDRLSCLRRRWNGLLSKTPEDQKSGLTITETQLRGWLTAYPTTNECTHFGCIMDPTEGKVRWIRGYKAGEVVEGLQSGKGLKVGARLKRERERDSEVQPGKEEEDTQGLTKS